MYYMKFSEFYMLFEAELYGRAVTNHTIKTISFLQEPEHTKVRRKEIRWTYNSLIQNNIPITDETPRFFARRYLKIVGMAAQLKVSDLGEKVLKEIAIEGWA